MLSHPYRVIGLFIVSGFVVPASSAVIYHLAHYGLTTSIHSSLIPLAISGTVAFGVLGLLAWSDARDHNRLSSPVRKRRIRIRLMSMFLVTVVFAAIVESGFEVAVARHAPGSSSAAIAFVTLPIYLVVIGILTYGVAAGAAALLMRERPQS